MNVRARRAHRRQLWGVSPSAAPAFSPDDIAGLVGWWDFSDATTLFTDTGLTTPVANDADVIKGVADKSDSEVNLTEATNGPAYKLNIQNGRSIARFDGSDDILTGTYVADASMTVLFVAKKVGAIAAASDGVIALHGTNSAGLGTNSAVSATNCFWVHNNSGANEVITGLTTPTSWHQYTLKVSSTASMDFYMDGTLGENINPSDNVTTGTTLELGRMASAFSSFGDWDIGEVLMYDTALDDTNRGLIEDYLQLRWGTP